MDPTKRQDEPPEGPEDEEAIRREAEAARRLAELLGTLPPAEDDEEGARRDAASRTRGRLKLDKTGALADRPKLQPVKPFARPGEGEGAAEGGEAGAEAAPPPPPEVPKGPRKAVIPPRIGALRPTELDAPDRPPPDDMVSIPSGGFLFGEDRESVALGAFEIDRSPVTHRAYERFVGATGHRPPLYWPDGRCPEELLDHPVVGVDYFDALAYARWCGKDLPYEDEWERAARGTDGRVYPWGNEPELGEANTARLALKMTLPVGWHEKNVSPDGLRDAVGNVWELTHSPAAGGGLVVRGGSWYDFALYAKTWFRFAAQPDARNGTIGFRCVRRAQPRPDAPREVAEEDLEAEIAARRGPQPEPDRTAFSPERRDLVPDLRRLRQLLADREAEQGAPLAAPEAARPPAETPAASPTDIAAALDRSVLTGAERRSAPPPAPREAAAPPAPPAPIEAPVPPVPEPASATTPTPTPAAPPAPAPSPPAPPTPRHPVSVSMPAAPRARPAAPAARTGDLLGRASARTWAVIGGGVVLAGVLLFFLFTRVLGGGGGGEAPHAPPALAGPTLPDGFPEAPTPSAEDAKRPRLVDGAAPAWGRAFEMGPWILVFADPLADGGTATARAVTDLQRRLRSRTVRVALVVPRAGLVDDEGHLQRDEVLVRRLQQAGVQGGVTVLIDGDLPEGDSVARTRWSVEDPVAAVLVVDGRLEARVAPTRASFTIEALAPLVMRALAH